MDNQRAVRLRTMPYEEYLKTPEWAKKREQALERDGRRCRNCNSGEKLHVHHRTYARRGHEDINDLTTLCQECHEHFHNRLRLSDSMHEERRISNPPRETLYRDGILRRGMANMQKWEDYLIGMLLRNAALFPYVYGIVDEDDFAGDDTGALYQALATTHSANQLPLSASQPIEELIPSNLKDTASRAIKSAEGMPGEMGTLVKEAVQVATRLKRQRLVRLYEDTTLLLKKAAIEGDKEGRRELQQRILGIQRQMHTIDSAIHLRL